MCLIITGKSNKIRATLTKTHGLLGDIFASNPDGIGIMYATTKGLKIVKTLPKNYADAFAFISKLPDDDRELAIHFRWTTHGNTDMDNCHPYNVVNGYVAMMHNGVLHTGNAADKTKSDTWHFIKDYLASPVSEHPAIIHNDGFLNMVADYIGDNRFVFMDGEGRMSHVNYDQGIEHDGLWFSNTYAWVPSKLIPNYYKSTKKSAYNYPTYSNAYSSAYDYDDEYGYWGYPKSTDYKKVSAHNAAWVEEEVDEFPPLVDKEELISVLADADSERMMDCLEADANKTLTLLFKYFEPSYRLDADDYLSSRDADMVKMVRDKDIAALMDVAHMPALADVMCYYFEWDEFVLVK